MSDVFNPHHVYVPGLGARSTSVVELIQKWKAIVGWEPQASPLDGNLTATAIDDDSFDVGMKVYLLEYASRLYASTVNVGQEDYDEDPAHRVADAIVDGIGALVSARGRLWDERHRSALEGVLDSLASKQSRLSQAVSCLLDALGPGLRAPEPPLTSVRQDLPRAVRAWQLLAGPFGEAFTRIRVAVHPACAEHARIFDVRIGSCDEYRLAISDDAGSVFRQLAEAVGGPSVVRETADPIAYGGDRLTRYVPCTVLAGRAERALSAAMVPGDVTGGVWFELGQEAPARSAVLIVVEGDQARPFYATVEVAGPEPGK